MKKMMKAVSLTEKYLIRSPRALDDETYNLPFDCYCKKTITLSKKVRQSRIYRILKKNNYLLKYIQHNKRRMQKNCKFIVNK